LNNISRPCTAHMVMYLRHHFLNRNLKCPQLPSSLPHGRPHLAPTTSNPCLVTPKDLFLTSRPCQTRSRYHLCTLECRKCQCSMPTSLSSRSRSPTKTTTPCTQSPLLAITHARHHTHRQWPIPAHPCVPLWMANSTLCLLFTKPCRLFLATQHTLTIQ
jgi:hypothetical protein